MIVIRSATSRTVAHIQSQRGESTSDQLETLAVDPRCKRSPAQAVEDKLCAILSDSPFRLSHMRITALPRRRIGR